MTVNMGSCMKSFAGEIEMTGLWIHTEMFNIVGFSFGQACVYNDFHYNFILLVFIFVPYAVEFIYISNLHTS